MLLVVESIGHLKSARLRRHYATHPCRRTGAVGRLLRRGTRTSGANGRPLLLGTRTNGANGRLLLRGTRTSVANTRLRLRGTRITGLNGRFRFPLAFWRRVLRFQRSLFLFSFPCTFYSAAFLLLPFFFLFSFIFLFLVHLRFLRRGRRS